LPSSSFFLRVGLWRCVSPRHFGNDTERSRYANEYERIARFIQETVNRLGRSNGVPLLQLVVFKQAIGGLRGQRL
jgi:hypothetical protein